MIDNDKLNDEDETKAEGDEQTTVDAEIVEDDQAEPVVDPAEPEVVEQAAETSTDEPTEEPVEEPKTGSSMPFYAVAVLAAVIVGTVIVVSGNQNTALVDQDGIMISEAGEESTILFPTPRTAEGPITAEPSTIAPVVEIPEPDETPVTDETESAIEPQETASAVEPDETDEPVEEMAPEAEEPTAPAELASVDEETMELTEEPSNDESVTDDVTMIADVAAPAEDEAPAEALTDETEVTEDLGAEELEIAEETSETVDTEPAGEEPAADETMAAEAETIETERAEGLSQLAEERDAERQAALVAEAEAEEQAARERIAGLRRLAEERATERRLAAADVAPAADPAPAAEPVPTPSSDVPVEEAPAPVAVIPDEQIETLRREIVENVASIVENVSDNVREGVTSDLLAQTEEAIDTRFAQTQAQVAQTQAQLQQTEQVIGTQLSQTQAALQQTDRRLAEIQQSLSAQQQASQAQISQLDNRIVQLQTRDVAVAQRGALLIAVTELGDRIDSGQPFRRQLNAIEAITGGRTELTELRPFADQGLPSSDAMRANFDEAARAALAGAKRDGADSVFDKFFANLAGLFTIRPVGEAEGDSVGAVIARAEQRLEGGDLAAATNELSQLEGSAETAFAKWVAAAEAKATASRGLRALEQQVTAPRRG